MPVDQEIIEVAVFVEEVTGEGFATTIETQIFEVVISEVGIQGPPGGGGSGGSITRLATAGTAGAYTVTGSGLSAYPSWTLVVIQPHVTCNAGATINIDGLGAIPIRRPDGTTAIGAGQLVAGMSYAAMLTTTGLTLLSTF